MKIVRGLLIAFLLFSGLGSTAGTALASDQATGYIQILTHVAARIPVAMQSKAGLQLLVPDLQAASARGQLIRFEPELQLGVLKVVYHAAAGTLNVGGRTVYSQLNDALPGGLPALLPASNLSAMGGGGGGPTCAPLAEASILRLDLNTFGGNCLYSGGHILGSVRDTLGHVAAVFDGYADSTGLIPNAAFAWGGGYSGLRPGFKVTFLEYDGATYVGTFTAKVPNLTFTSINKSLSIVKGHGPAGKTVELHWQQIKWDALQTSHSVAITKVVPSTGTWSVDFGAFPLLGGDVLAVGVRINPNVVAYRQMEVPFIDCQVGGSFCSLTGFAGTPASFQIVHGGVPYSFSGFFNPAGYFFVDLLKSDGTPIIINPGDQVSGTGVLAYPVPKLTAGMNVTTNVVSGKAPANKYVDVQIFDAPSSILRTVYSHVSSVGTYSSDFTLQLDLLANYPYLVAVIYGQPNTGNETDLFKPFGP